MSVKISSIVARHIRGENIRSSSPDFNPDLDSLLTLEEIMVPLNRSLRSLAKAYTLFIRLKAPRVTPDGMIGGKGFVMPLKDIKDTIDHSIESLTNVINAIEDEISNNPVWQEAKTKREEEQKEAEKEEEIPSLDTLPTFAPEDESKIQEEDSDTIREHTNLEIIPQYVNEISQETSQDLVEELRSP